MSLHHDPAYSPLSPEEFDALTDRELDMTPAGEHDARDFAARADRVRRRYRADERAARAALYPRSGNVRVEPR